MSDAERVVNERRIELTAKIFARRQLELGRKRASVHAHAARDKTLVEPPQKVGQPTAVELRGYDLEAREAFQDSGHDQCRKCKFYLVRIDACGDGSLLRVRIPIDPCESGEFVQAERHRQLLSSGPERVINFGMKRQLDRKS